MSLPEKLDEQKLAEAALAILSLSRHGHEDPPRVWKGLDWDLMDILYERGWITDPRTRAKSVMLTEEGKNLSDEILERHFTKHRE